MLPVPPAIPPEPPVPIKSNVPTTPAELSPPMSLRSDPPVPAVLAATIVSSRAVRAAIGPVIHRHLPRPAELPLTVQPVKVRPWPRLVLNRPPPAAAELPLTVLSVSVVDAAIIVQRAPKPAELPLIEQPGQRARARASLVLEQAAARGGGVAADGAAGQRERAAVVIQAAAVPGGRAPPEMVRPLKVAVTPLST